MGSPLPFLGVSGKIGERWGLRYCGIGFSPYLAQRDVAFALLFAQPRVPLAALFAQPVRPLKPTLGAHLVSL